MLTMRPAIAAGVLAGLLCACQAQGGAGETARARIAQAPAATAKVWEQRVTDGDRVLVTRLCLDGAAAKSLAAFTARRRAAAPTADRPTREITVDAGWRGPCPADLPPGEMTSPDGRRFKIADLTRDQTS